MSTLAEIEAATATLSPQEFAEFDAFIEQVRAKHAEEARLDELARRNGVHPVRRRPGALVTTELVRQICEEEGI